MLSSIWTLERLIDLAMMTSVGGDACKLVLYAKTLRACLVVVARTYAADVFPSQSVQHCTCPVVISHFL